MDKQHNDHHQLKNCDMLAWRVANIQRREDVHDKRLAYNLRPRLRREEHTVN